MPKCLPKTTEHKFWEKVLKTETCWIWTGCRSDRGYGIFTVNGKRIKAHRFSFALAFGEMPAGLVTDHLCRNRACVRPVHLQAVTDKVNVMRGESFAPRNALKSHCSKGHEFSPDNTYLTRAGKRMCRICSRERWRQIYAKSRT